jgi:hypothetical protein
MDKAPKGSTDSRRKPAPESPTFGAAVAQAVRATAPDAGGSYLCSGVEGWSGEWALGPGSPPRIPEIPVCAERRYPGKGTQTGYDVGDAEQPTPCRKLVRPRPVSPRRCVRVVGRL